MTAAPTWTILVPTLGERVLLFERLMAGLLPQLDVHEGRVRVVGWHNNGSPSLPRIRQTMVLGTTTDYLSFVDDDDLVAPHYVDEIVAALQTRPDYIGFQVQCYSDGHPTAVSYHSLEFSRWRNLADHYERDISHLNPIRSLIARRADFTRTRQGGAEDRAWADQLRRSGLLKNQVVIPRIMYHYLYAPKSSAWQRPSRITTGHHRQVVDHPYFSWQD